MNGQVVMCSMIFAKHGYIFDNLKCHFKSAEKYLTLGLTFDILKYNFKSAGGRYDIHK